MINILRKVFSLILGASLPGMIIRIVFIFICVFLIIPQFYPRFLSLRIKAEFFILGAILLEVLVAKLKIPSKQDLTTPTSSGNLLNNLLFFNSLNKISSKKQCCLFLHTSEVRPEALLTNYNYKLLELENISDNQLQIFDNYYNTVISCGLEYFRKLLETDNHSLLKIKLIRYLKKSKYPSVSIIINVEDLIKIKERQGNLILNLYACIQFLNKKLGHKTNINFIIDNIAKIRGFYELISLADKEYEDNFGFSFLTDINDLKVVTDEFNLSFKQFIMQTEKRVAHAHDYNPIKHQLAYIFIQQFRYLQEPLCKLVECIVLFRKYPLFHWWRQSLITINFINTKEPESKNLSVPTILEEFKSYIEEK